MKTPLRKAYARTLATIGATALLLTACGGSTTTASSPEEAVAQGLEQRFSEGAAFVLHLEGDPAALAEAGEDVPEGMRELFGEAAARGAFHPDRGFALSIGADGGFVELRYVDEALYLQIDPEQIASQFPEVGDPSQYRDFLQAPGVPPQFAELGAAALDGDWIAVTGMTQQAVEDLVGSLGAVTGATTAPDSEEAMRLAEEYGFTSGATFTERYLVVEGDGPTYDVRLKMRELVTASSEMAAELDAAASAGDMPDAEEVPEEVGGIQVTVEDDKATQLRIDLAVLAASAEPDDVPIEEGDFVIVLELGDLGDELATPDAAATIAFDELMGELMGAFMGGMGGLSG